MLKSVNLLKGLSILIFLGTLVLVYAYAPVMIKLEISSGLELHRESFFYFSMAFVLVVNLALLGFERMFEPRIHSEPLKAWVRGLTFVINFYFALIIAFVGVINNPQHLSVAGFSYLNYIGPVLIATWILGLAYLIYKK